MNHSFYSLLYRVGMSHPGFFTSVLCVFTPTFWGPRAGISRVLAEIGIHLLETLF